MKKRNPFAVVILSIITLGIYDLYWLVKTKSVLNQKTKHHTPSIWLLFLPFLLLIVGYIMLFATGAIKTNTCSSSLTNYGSQSNCTTLNNHIAGAAIVSILLTVVGGLLTFFISIYWFFKFSKAVNEYTEGKMSTALTFLILWLIHLIGVALIQDTFNDMIESGSEPGQPVAAGGPQQPLNTPPPSQPAPQNPNVMPPPSNSGGGSVINPNQKIQ